MIGFVQDDGGRAAAGYRGTAGDCVVRALAILTDRPYRECYQKLARRNKIYTGKRSARNGVNKQAYEAVFADVGLTKISLTGTRPTYTEAWERYGDCIVTTARHVCALVGGVLRDTFDGRTYSSVDFQGTVQRKAMTVYAINPVGGVRPNVRLDGQRVLLDGSFAGYLKVRERDSANGGHRKEVHFTDGFQGVWVGWTEAAAIDALIVVARIARDQGRSLQSLLLTRR